MPERVPCEFSVVRYVPDPIKGEFVNIGVLLREAALADPQADDPARTRVRFTRDWSRVRCMDRNADVDLLESLEQEIAARLVAGTSLREPRAVLDVLEDSLSNSIQMTEPRASLAENLTTEMEQLMRMYVEPLRTARTADQDARTAGRTGLLRQMRTEFERAGVWRAMAKRIPVKQYLDNGDPLRIDCGYRKASTGPGAGEAIRMFHAVSLAGDLEMAKVLAFSAGPLREGVARVEGSELEFTAVVEPLRTIASEEGDAEERYRFGVETLEQQAIRVITLNDLARAAQTARTELGF